MEQTPPGDNAQHSYITQPAPKRSRTGWHVAFGLFVGLPAILFWLTFGLLFLGVMSILGGSDDELYCNVARVPLHGIITSAGDGFQELLGLGMLSSADDFVAAIEGAERDEYIDAILVDIDSPGGTPVGGDEMMAALMVVEKPVVAVVRDLGASAAYWAAAGADHIIASPVSNVGSIGVTMSYLETASSTDIEGSRWVDLSSGDYKDAGNPERPLSEIEATHFRGQVDEVHDYMVNRIAEARATLSREDVSRLADGRAYVGTRAIELKLVDALGGFAEARTWLAEQVGMGVDEVVLCEPYASGWEALF